MLRIFRDKNKGNKNDSRNISHQIFTYSGAHKDRYAIFFDTIYKLH
jgi:hypothetical protein